MARIIEGHFASVSALLAHAEAPIGFEHGDKRAEQFMAVTEPLCRPSFVGVEEGTTWADLRERFAHGLPAELARMREEIARTEVPVIKSVRRRGAWSEQGDELNRDRLYSGYGDCWRTARRMATSAQPYIRVVAEIGGASNVKAADLFYSGAAACALSEALVAAGYEVEILGGIFTRSATETARGVQAWDNVTTVVVKGFQAPLALPPVLAALASSPFFRTAVLASRCRAAGSKRAKTAEGMGSAQTLLLEHLPVAPRNVQTIIVPRVLNRHDANEAVRDAVRALQGEEAAPAAPAPRNPRPTPPPARRPLRRGLSPDGAERLGGAYQFTPPGAPPESVNLDDEPSTEGITKGATVTFQGQPWRVDYVGPTKYGVKAKLVRGADVRWVAPAMLKVAG